MQSQLLTYVWVVYSPVESKEQRSKNWRILIVVYKYCNMPKLFFPDPLVRGMDPLLSRLCIIFSSVYCTLLYLCENTLFHYVSLKWVSFFLFASQNCLASMILHTYIDGELLRIMVQSCEQCSGSVTFWYGSGSLDPHLWQHADQGGPKTDPDPVPLLPQVFQGTVGQNTLFSSDFSKHSQFFPIWILYLFALI